MVYGKGKGKQERWKKRGPRVRGEGAGRDIKKNKVTDEEVAERMWSRRRTVKKTITSRQEGRK